MLTGARLEVGPRADARSRLISELAAAPARKGYGIAYDLLGNRAEVARTPLLTLGAPRLLRAGVRWAPSPH